jgi:hypothetical protein
VEIARCLTENCAEECAGSIFQVDAAAGAGSEVATASAVLTAMRPIEWPIIISPYFSFALSR